MRAPSLFGRHQPGSETPRLPHLRLVVFDLRAPARAVLEAWTPVAEALLDHGLHITFGLGPGACDAARRPVRLRGLPAFDGDDLAPAMCGGDLVAHVAAEDPARAAAAAGALASAGGGGGAGGAPGARGARRGPP